MAQKVHFEYGPDTTLGGLLEHYFRQTKASPKQLAAAIGAGEELVLRWGAGEMTVGLTTKLYAAFQKATGIDLERLMVVEAKRRIASGGTAVPWDRLQTREEIVAAISTAAKESSGPLVAEQLGVTEKSVGAWVAGKNKPDIDTLVTILPPLLAGLLQGMRDDVAYGLLKRRIFGNGPDPLTELPLYTDALKAMRHYQGDMDHERFARWSSLDRSIVRRLRQYDGRNGKTEVGTIRRVIHFLVSQRSPEYLTLFEGPHPEKMAPPRTGPGAYPQAGAPAPANGAPVGRREPPADAPPAPAAVAPELPGDPLAAGLAEVANGLMALGRRVEVLSRLPQQRRVPTASEADGFAGPGHEPGAGIRFRLNRETFRDWPGERFSAAESDDTVALIAELRRRMNIVAGMDPIPRRQMLAAVAEELDELWHSLSALKSDLPAAALEVIELERQGFGETRQQLRKSLQEGEKR